MDTIVFRMKLRSGISQRPMISMKMKPTTSLAKLILIRLVRHTLLAVVSELRRNHCEQTNDRFM
jgi:hypothetical protein